MSFVARISILIPLTVALTGCVGPLKSTGWRPGSGDYDLSLPPAVPSQASRQTSLKTPSQDQGTESLIVRNQNSVPAGNYWQQEVAPDGSGRPRYPLATSGASASAMVPGSSVRPAQYSNPATQTAIDLWGLPPGATGGYPAQTLPPPQAPGQAPIQMPPGQAPPNGNYPPPSVLGTPSTIGPAPNQVAPHGELLPPYAVPNGPAVSPEGGMLGVPSPLTDIFVNVQETQTGRFMLGAAVNSDAGVTGQIVIDEKNFDWRRVPTSFDDFVNGSAFRGAGQGFRLEAMPGDEVQRYMLQFTEPYLFNTRISMNLSGYLFDRRFFDWDEQRLGGRIGLGYRITPDLSLSFSLRGEEVVISDPRVVGVPELDEAVGHNDLYSGRVTLIQDTRDIPFQPTQGYYLEMSFEQVFGTYDYSRGDIDFRRYFLLAERPDGSGRHVLGFSNRAGFSGNQTPVFENYFAGGYSTLRGFDFRRASPQSGGVTVGGRFQFLGSVEYLFPITADDMLKGVAFCDYGTVEEDIKINAEDYRVSLGMGLRIFVPAMGPAPIALDFAVPVAREDTDEIRQFSFFIGVSR